MTSKSILIVLSVLLLPGFFLGIPAVAQSGKGVISGRVADSGGAVLQGAWVELQPNAASTVTNQQGEFTVSGLAPGDYTVTVSYVGFAPFSDKVSVTAASFRMYKGLQFVFAGLNLTNEVFRFYAGSSVYPIQREYYKPSYEFGMRYIFASEQK